MQHCPASCEAIQLSKVTEKRDAYKSDLLEKSKDECIDKHEHCPQWADLGECEANTDVQNYCKRSCSECGNDSDEACKDTHENCKFWADHGECEVSVEPSLSQRKNVKDSPFFTTCFLLRTTPIT